MKNLFQINQQSSFKEIPQKRSQILTSIKLIRFFISVFFIVSITILTVEYAQAQNPSSINVCYVPSAKTSPVADYTLDGSTMWASGTTKLQCTANFGPGGTVSPTKVFIVSLGTGAYSVAQLNALNCNVVFTGLNNAGAASGTALPTGVSGSDVKAIYDWSLLKPNNLVIVNQGYMATSGTWGYTGANGTTGVTNQATVSGLQTEIFDGPFGLITSYGQGGSYQGTISNPFNCAQGTVLAVKGTSNGSLPVLVLDRASNDILCGDIDIFTSLGGVTNGCGITSTNDRLFMNTFAYAIRLATIVPYTAPAGTVFVDNGNGGGIAGNCKKESGETTSLPTPLFVKAIQKSCSNIQVVVAVATVNTDGSYTFTEGLTPDDYTFVLDDNNSPNDTNPFLPTGWSGTNVSPLTTVSTEQTPAVTTFCLAPPCVAITTTPTLSDATISNVCPANTVNLSTSISSNTPSGTVLEFHSAFPATATNLVATPTAAAAGTYIAIYRDTINNCYGNPAGPITATVTTCCASGQVPTVR
nr:hypothetical protein [uncultured Emticicia sp.]